MRGKVTSFLKKCPLLYKYLSLIYWNLQLSHIQELLMGSKAREKYWSKRTIGKGYWESIGFPSRSYLVDRISSYEPINNILEVGCASGPNLYLLAKKYPNAKIVGVDINAEAIEYGNTCFKKNGIPNVQLICRKADELDVFSERSFDIVFTNALLFAIGPDKIHQVVKGLLNITRRELILMELHLFRNRKDPKGNGFYYGGNWLRDYESLFLQYVDKSQIRINKIPVNVWPYEPWSKYGALIEIERNTMTG